MRGALTRGLLTASEDAILAHLLALNLERA